MEVKRFLHAQHGRNATSSPSVQSPGARAGEKKIKRNLSGSTGRCCQLIDALGPLDIAARELPKGLGCISPGIPWHFWAGLHTFWSQTTCLQAAGVALGVLSLGHPCSHIPGFSCRTVFLGSVCGAGEWVSKAVLLFKALIVRVLDTDSYILLSFDVSASWPGQPEEGS